MSMPKELIRHLLVTLQFGPGHFFDVRQELPASLLRKLPFEHQVLGDGH